MRLNVLTVLRNLDGIALKEPNEKGEVSEVILRKILVNALMIPAEKDTGTQKVMKYMLAMDIQKNDEVEVTPEQIVLLKNAVGYPYGPLVVGPVWNLLDGKDA
jgi:hypothetical protein